MKNDENIFAHPKKKVRIEVVVLVCEPEWNWEFSGFSPWLEYVHENQGKISQMYSTS